MATMARMATWSIIAVGVPGVLTPKGIWMTTDVCTETGDSNATGAQTDIAPKLPERFINARNNRGGLSILNNEILGDVRCVSVLSALSGVKIRVTLLNDCAEAMFADLGHCSQFSLRGEAAYLSKHREDLQGSFYRAILGMMTLQGFKVTFSSISHCRALKCFTPVKIVHTYEDMHGRIYIQEVIWALMVICLAVLSGFRDSDYIGNACGLAAISVMLWTTCLMFPIITTMWKCNFSVALILVPMFEPFVTDLPAFHDVIIFVTLETVFVPKVSANEGFSITHVGQPEHHIFRCTVRRPAVELGSSFFKKFAIIIYGFLRQNCRRPAVEL